MHYLDQSIKIENTQQSTYVGVTNGSQFVAAITASDKRQLQQTFRLMGKPFEFILFTFSVLSFSCIQRIHIRDLTIDPEYPGHEADIKNYLTQLFQMHQLIPPQIRFQPIGKKNNAHIHVYRSYKQNYSDVQITSSKVLKLYKNINTS